MKHILNKIIAAALILTMGALTVYASESESGVPETAVPDSAVVRLTPVKAEEATNAAPRKFGAKFRRHFTWGVDVGASIDLSGEDMSTFDAETYFGYKGGWVRTAALGAGIHKAFGNKYTFIPLYAMLRTSFRKKPSLLFFELKLGYSFNTLADSGSFGGAYGSAGLGFNLAMTKTFQSHIVLSYSYFTLHSARDMAIPYSGDNINSAVLKFGINF